MIYASSLLSFTANNFFWRGFHLNVGMDVENECFCTETGEAGSKQDLINIFGDDQLPGLLFSLASRLNHLQLTDVEIALCKVIGFLFTGRFCHESPLFNLPHCFQGKVVSKVLFSLYSGQGHVQGHNPVSLLPR